MFFFSSVSAQKNKDIRLDSLEQKLSEIHKTHPEEAIEIGEIILNHSNSETQRSRVELIIQSTSDLKNVSVYNLSGQLIMNSKSKKVNTKSLSSGVYIVKAELENGKTETFKIIKK